MRMHMYMTFNIDVITKFNGHRGLMFLALRSQYFYMFVIKFMIAINIWNSYFEYLKELHGLLATDLTNIYIRGFFRVVSFL